MIFGDEIGRRVFGMGDGYFFGEFMERFVACFGFGLTRLMVRGRTKAFDFVFFQERRNH